MTQKASHFSHFVNILFCFALPPFIFSAEAGFAPEGALDKGKQSAASKGEGRGRSPLRDSAERESNGKTHHIVPTFHI